jgi:hypothetical protein
MNARGASSTHKSDGLDPSRVPRASSSSHHSSCVRKQCDARRGAPPGRFRRIARRATTARNGDHGATRRDARRETRCATRRWETRRARRRARRRRARRR